VAASKPLPAARALAAPQPPPRSLQVPRKSSVSSVALALRPSRQSAAAFRTSATPAAPALRPPPRGAASTAIEDAPPQRPSTGALPTKTHWRTRRGQWTAVPE
jgi:hypothetical protein